MATELQQMIDNINASIHVRALLTDDLIANLNDEQQKTVDEGRDDAAGGGTGGTPPVCPGGGCSWVGTSISSKGSEGIHSRAWRSSAGSTPPRNSTTATRSNCARSS